MTPKEKLKLLFFGKDKLKHIWVGALLYCFLLCISFLMSMGYWTSWEIYKTSIGYFGMCLLIWEVSRGIPKFNNPNFRKKWGIPFIITDTILDVIYSSIIPIVLFFIM